MTKLPDKLYTEAFSTVKHICFASSHLGIEEEAPMQGRVMQPDRECRRAVAKAMAASRRIDHGQFANTDQVLKKSGEKHDNFPLVLAVAMVRLSLK